MPIPLAIPLIASLAGTAFGAIKAGKHQRKNDRLLQKQFGELDSWYDNASSTRYMDTQEGRSALEQLYRQTLAGSDRSLRRQKVTGGTQEARLADRQADMSNIANMIMQLAARGTSYRENIRKEYLGRKGRLQDFAMGNNQQKAQNWQNVGANITNGAMGLAALGGLGGGDGFGGFLKNLFGKKKQSQLMPPMALSGNAATAQSTITNMFG